MKKLFVLIITCMVSSIVFGQPDIDKGIRQKWEDKNFDQDLAQKLLTIRGDKIKELENQIIDLKKENQILNGKNVELAKRKQILENQNKQCIAELGNFKEGSFISDSMRPAVYDELMNEIEKVYENARKYPEKYIRKSEEMTGEQK